MPSLFLDLGRATDETELELTVYDVDLRCIKWELGVVSEVCGCSMVLPVLARPVPHLPASNASSLFYHRLLCQIIPIVGNSNSLFEWHHRALQVRLPLKQVLDQLTAPGYERLYRWVGGFVISALTAASRRRWVRVSE